MGKAVVINIEVIIVIYINFLEINAPAKTIIWGGTSKKCIQSIRIGYDFNSQDFAKNSGWRVCFFQI